MQESLEEAREGFFSAVSHRFRIPERIRLLLVTHLLEDRPVLVRALAACCQIEVILGIPYSVVACVQSLLSVTHRVVVRSLDEMLNKDTMYATAASLIEEDQTPLAIMEIGGYFAPVGNDLRARFGGSFLGVVEDTENGHRRYEDNRPLKFPVISIARSPLKLVEDRLIGSSIIFSLERFLRGMGQVLAACNVGVLGYGRIGSGVARAAIGRGSRVAVFDISGIRRALAIAEGFACPDRDRILANSDVIVGATGRCSILEEDLPLLKSGVVLASGSSKQVEFDIRALERLAVAKDAAGSIVRYRFPDRRHVYLLQDGEPINFRDGAVVGPAISLSQAELLVGLGTLVKMQDRTGISSVDGADQDELASIWLNHFTDTRGSGGPRMQLDFLAGGND